MGLRDWLTLFHSELSSLWDRRGKGLRLASSFDGIPRRDREHAGPSRGRAEPRNLLEN